MGYQDRVLELFYPSKKSGKRFRLLYSTKFLSFLAEAEWPVSSSGSTCWLKCLSPQFAAICVIDDNPKSKELYLKKGNSKSTALKFIYL